MKKYFAFKLLLVASFILAINSQATIKALSSSTLGPYISDGNNKALYIFQGDSPNNSTCTGQCAVIWPPFLVDKNQKVTAESSSITGDIGYIMYNSTLNQVTLNSFPLYYYNKEVNSPNTTQGQYMSGKWFIIQPNGRINFSNPSLLATAMSTGATLTLSQNKAFGDYYITDSKGATLYMFYADKFMKSTCFDQCAANWPPYLRSNNTALSVGPGVDKTLIAFAIRKDPTSGAETQIYTYNGYPLYYYAPDGGQPGSVTGQDIELDGGYWYIMLANGSINEQGTKSATTPTSEVPWFKETSSSSISINYLILALSLIVLIIDIF